MSEPNYSQRAVAAAHVLMGVTRRLEARDWEELASHGDADSDDEKGLLGVRMWECLLEFLDRFDPAFDIANTPYVTVSGLYPINSPYGEPARSPVFRDGPGRLNMPKVDLAEYLDNKGSGKGSGKDLGKDSGNDFGKGSGKDLVGKDSGKDFSKGKGSGKDFGKDSGKDFGKGSSDYLFYGSGYDHGKGYDHYYDFYYQGWHGKGCDHSAHGTDYAHGKGSGRGYDDYSLPEQAQLALLLQAYSYWDAVGEEGYDDDAFLQQARQQARLAILQHGSGKSSGKISSGHRNY